MIGVKIMTKFVCTEAINVPIKFGDDVWVDAGDEIEVIWRCRDTIQFKNLTKGIKLFVDNEGDEFLANHFKSISPDLEK